jgi:hypothetical protein
LFVLLLFPGAPHSWICVTHGGAIGKTVIVVVVVAVVVSVVVVVVVVICVAVVVVVGDHDGDVGVVCCW